VRWVLTDPRRRPYLVIWTSDDGGVRHGLKMAAAESQDAVLVTLETGETYRIRIPSRPLPRGTGVALFYRCLWCGKPRRYLYSTVLRSSGSTSSATWGSGARFAPAFAGVLRVGIGPNLRKPSCPACLASAIHGIPKPYRIRG
jgi:hypothetical protein